MPQCQQQCSADARCNLAGYVSADQICYLKGSITPRAFSKNPAVVMSIKNPPEVKGVQYAGRDYPYNDVVSLTLGDEGYCQRLGMLSPGVTGSVYMPSSGTCWLKQQLIGAAYNNDRNTFIFTKR